MIVIRDYREVDRDNWAQFVAGHPQGNIFHTPEMFDLFSSDKKNDTVFISVVTPAKMIIGLLIAYIHKEFKGFAGEFTSRAIIWGGPLILENDPVTAELLIEELNIICRKKAVYSQFRNLWDIGHYKNNFEKAGYKYEDHLNFLFNLNIGEELLWKNIHPTRRKQINRSIKRGVNSRISDELMQDELEGCYFILKQVYDSAKLPYPDFEYFQRVFQILGKLGYLKTILATLDEKIIGFRFFLAYKGLLYDWYAGSLPEHHDKYPNDLLPWELMKWGSNNGYHIFDFGGAGKPGVPYGVRDYKMKFGGQLVNYGRYEKVHKPIIMMLARIGFKIWRLFK
ncbi:MAG: GNAT family N-acetyltransferase [Bacteroidales bacterium]